jgi:hypothetical protein
MKRIIIIAFAIINLVACKKENGNNPTSTNYLIKTTQGFTGNNTTPDYIDSFFYDSNNQLINFSHVFGNSRNYFTVNYLTDSITITGYNAANPNNFSMSEKHLLYSNGLARKSINYFNNSISSFVENNYDADGYVSSGLSTPEFGSPLYFTYTISNGNTIKKLFSATLSTLTDTVFIEFDLSKQNTIGNYNFGKSYLGKSDINLIMKETRRINSITSSLTTYYYIFDDKNRVIEKVTTKTTYNPATSTTRKIKYTYY